MDNVELKLDFTRWMHMEYDAIEDAIDDFVDEVVKQTGTKFPAQLFYDPTYNAASDIWAMFEVETEDFWKRLLLSVLSSVTLVEQALFFVKR